MFHAPEYGPALRCARPATKATSCAASTKSASRNGNVNPPRRQGFGADTPSVRNPRNAKISTRNVTSRPTRNRQWTVGSKPILSGSVSSVSSVTDQTIGHKTPPASADPLALSRKITNLLERNVRIGCVTVGNDITQPPRAERQQCIHMVPQTPFLQRQIRISSAAAQSITKRVQKRIQVVVTDHKRSLAGMSVIMFFQSRDQLQTNGRLA